MVVVVAVVIVVVLVITYLPIYLPIYLAICKLAKLRGSKAQQFCGFPQSNPARLPQFSKK